MDSKYSKDHVSVGVEDATSSAKPRYDLSKPLPAEDAISVPVRVFRA